ncbi:trypsin-like peptidase domain-containing protein [Acidobacteria bacterium AH-259-G07]|nr:trypsin-like peptidase domain-containing protein [Acidobacteria bacterium AH-259-G07]
MKKTSRLRAAVSLWILAMVPLYGQEHASPKVRIPPDDLSGEELQAVELYRKVLPTVVTIFTLQKIITREGEQKQRGVGSGVLISPECHVLTAAHVVEDAEQISVKTHDGKSRRAELVYSESSADIALLRLLTPAPELKHATLGDSDRLAVGQMAYVVGAPFGLENSFSVGHISGFREFNRLYDGTILAEFIQTDAAINSGNSGGPVFNSKGEVIGIASLILSRSGGFEGLGFVVAIDTAKQLLVLEDRGWMGIEAIFLNREELARLLNLDLEGGLLVQRVVTGSPAEKAGLRGGSVPAQIFDQRILLGGDLILEFNKQEACHSECLAQAGKGLAGLDRIPVKFLRGGKVMQTVVDVSKTRRNFLKN